MRADVIDRWDRPDPRFSRKTKRVLLDTMNCIEYKIQTLQSLSRYLHDCMSCDVNTVSLFSNWYCSVDVNASLGLFVAGENRGQVTLLDKQYKKVVIKMHSCAFIALYNLR